MGSGQKAGLGVWWGEDNKLNSSKRVTGEKPTKNSSEVQAATEAIKVAGKAELKKLLIHTDSQFLINCSGWIAGWKKKGWVTGKGEPVKNKEDLMDMDKALTENEGLTVKWTLTKDKDGNKGASQLAVAGAKLT